MTSEKKWNETTNKFLKPFLLDAGEGTTVLVVLLESK